MMRSRSRAVRAASLTFLPVVLAAFAIGAAVQQGNNGDSRVRTREMNGFQEIPTVMTTGVGDFEAKIDDAFIEYTLSYAALEGGATIQAHIHFGNNYTNGGVSAFLCGGGDKPPCPPVAGTISGIIDPTDVIGPPTPKRSPRMCSPSS